MLNTEYGIGGRVSREGDVYSYGILVLEMMTGKRPTDEMFAEDVNLHNWVKSAFPHRVAEVVDARLLHGMEGDELLKRCGTSLVGLGLGCSRDAPQERPSMKECVRVLLSMKESLNGSTAGGQRPTISELVSDPAARASGGSSDSSGDSSDSSST